MRSTRARVITAAAIGFGTVACPPPEPVVPDDLAGHYQWRNIMTPSFGTLTVIPDSIEGGRDTLMTSEGTMILCQRLREPRCPIRCEVGSRVRAWSAFCFETGGDGFEGSFQSCIVRQVPVRRRVVDPNTGQVRIVKELVTRNFCRDVERLEVERLWSRGE